jgi:uncharacterized membrane protein required for colicin V production/cell division septation protein DedD
MKERLTGAIILVALIVLLVPELLTGPIRSAPRAMASAAGEPPLRSYTITLGDEAHSKPAEPQGASAAVSPAPVPLPTPAAPSKDDTVVAGTPPAPDTAAVVAAAPVPTPPAATTRSKRASGPRRETRSFGARSHRDGRRVAGQLGSFASRSNAERLAQQLKGRAGQRLAGQQRRHLYRVRWGRYTTTASRHAAAGETAGGRPLRFDRAEVGAGRVTRSPATRALLYNPPRGAFAVTNGRTNLGLPCDYAILVSAIAGAMRGFLREATRLRRLIVALFFARHFDLTSRTSAGFMDLTVRPWAARVIIVVLVLLLGTAIGWLLQHSWPVDFPAGSAARLWIDAARLRGARSVVILGQLLRLSEEGWWRHSLLIPHGESIANGLRSLVGEPHVAHARGEVRT